MSLQYLLTSQLSGSVFQRVGAATESSLLSHQHEVMSSGSYWAKQTYIIMLIANLIYR